MMGIKSVKTMLLGLLLVFIGITLGLDFSHVAAWVMGIPYSVVKPLPFVALLFIGIGSIIGFIGYFRKD